MNLIHGKLPQHFTATDEPVGGTRIRISGLRAWICLSLVLAVVACYAQTATHEFVIFDDDGYVSDNPHVKAGLTTESIRWAFRIDTVAYWHPITWLSHMMDVELFGLNPGGHHLTNVMIHAASTVLLFLVLFQMTSALWESVLVAALFSLHPINVESVAWIAERKNLLSTFFWIATIGFYWLYVRRPSAVRYGLALTGFAAGLMCKPMPVTLPFVLLLLDFWPLARIRFSGKGSFRKPSGLAGLVLEKTPFFILSTASIVISSLSVRRLDILIPLETVSMSLRLENALASYVKYIGKMLWPADLSVFYPYPSIVPLWQVVGAVALLTVLSVAAARLSIRMPALGVGWLWYLGTLTPAVGLFQAGLWPAMADRWAYVPLIGLFICVVWGCAGWLRKRDIGKMLPAGLSISLVIACAVMTHAQVRHWKDSVALFTRAADVERGSQLAHFNLGVALEQAGRFSEALDRYAEAVRINPEYLEARKNLGLALAASGRPQDAIAQFEEILRQDPGNADAYNNLGSVMLAHGKTKPAVHCFQLALQRNPEHADAYNNLGIAMVREGKIESALSFFQRAAAIAPDDARIQGNLKKMTEPGGIIDETIKARPAVSLP